MNLRNISQKEHDLSSLTQVVTVVPNDALKLKYWKLILYYFLINNITLIFNDRFISGSPEGWTAMQFSPVPNRNTSAHTVPTYLSLFSLLSRNSTDLAQVRLGYCVVH